MRLHHPLNRILPAVAAAFLLASCASTPVDPQAALQRAASAMGANQVQSLQFSAAGSGGVFGQAWRPDDPWPKITYASFTRHMDYANGAMREEWARSRAEPNGGGATPLMGQGEQRVTGFVRGNHAWGPTAAGATPAPLAVDQRVHDLWTSPHGVIKAAMRNAASARSDGGRTAVSFAEPNRFRATAWIGADGLVERVDSVVPHPVMGDTAVSTLYEGYRDHGGVKFPSRIRQSQGGHPVLDLQVSQVAVNTPLAADTPANVPAFAERPAPEKVADGVWFLAGGSHNSVLVEMADHLVLVEAPLYDGRSQAVFATARQLAPNKPVRYVINSHHHFDHAGGLRTAAAEGAILVTSDIAKPWFERAFATANTISPDALARSGRPVRIEAAGNQRTFTDGTRSLHVFPIADSVHSQGFLMVWLPRERMVVQADAYTPLAPNAPPPDTPNANNVNLVQNIDRLRLDVDRILPLHGRVVPMSELRTTAAGRR